LTDSGGVVRHGQLLTQLKTQKESSDNLKGKVVENPETLPAANADSCRPTIISLITDNPSTMTATRRKLSEHFSNNESLTFLQLSVLIMLSI
jgi:hypothetical protein